MEDWELEGKSISDFFKQFESPKELTHLGYTGSIEYSEEDGCYWGKILYTTDVVTYESDTLDGLEGAFQEAVEDYLLTINELRGE